MGRVIQAVSVIGILILAVIVVMAILSLTGQFDPSYRNPSP